MNTSRLACVRLTIAMLSMLALGMTIASAAQAENTLRWKVEGKELKANETREITVTRWSANPASPVPLTLEGAGLVIKCEVATTVAGKSFLANETIGATSRAIAIWEPEFSKCTQTGNGAEPGCKVEEPIKVEPVRAELVLSDNEPGIGKKVLGESDPISKSLFVKIKFKEEAAKDCKINPIEVTGLVIGSLFTDPLAPGAPTEPTQIERTVNATTEYSSFLLKNPDEPKSIYLWKLEESKEEFKLFEPTGLKVVSEKAKLTGTRLILLAKNGKSNGEKYGLVE